MKTETRCRLAAFGLLLSSLAGAAAWDDTGHLLTMRIAYDRLSPAKQTKLREELAGLRIDDRDFSNPAVAATYMDGVRAKTRRYPGHPRGVFEGMFRDWHFVRLDYTPDGGALPSGPPAADGHADVIRGWHRARELYLARQTQPFPYAGETWPVGPREALALLLHLTGDAHQPLHTTSHPLPNGDDDSGGNGVDVDNGTSLNLHGFWDSAYRRTTYLGRGGVLRVGEDPARRAARDAGVENPALGEIARAIIAASGLSEEQLAAAARQLDPAEWVRESHARGFADGYQALGSAQEKWFRERLAASTAPWKIAYFHHPPHHSSTHHGTGSAAMRAWNFPAAGLAAVFTGHVHGYERMEQNGAGIFVVGLGGAPIHAFHSAAAQHAPGSKKRFPHPLPPPAEWPRHCGALFVEATAQKITFEFRAVGHAAPIDRWSVTAP